MYELTILIQGFPGRSVTNGGLGWSTVALLSKRNQYILVDTGGFGARAILLSQLKKKGIAPEAISTVLLTHSHWDHIVNYVLFPNAEIVISRVEMEWALGLPLIQANVPELYIRDLSQSPRLRLIEHLDEVLPNIKAHIMSGHTPGQIVFVVDNGANDIILAFDVAKNKAELLSRHTDMSLDPELSKQAINEVWKLWERKAGSTVVLGHDIPMVLDQGEPRYLGQREVMLEAIYGTDLTDLTSLI